MLLVLWLQALLLAALGAFMFLLVRKDISPGIAFQKMRNRFAKRPPPQLPNFHDAPYHRLSVKTPGHQPTVLNIRTSEGTGQACHPDVIYIREGFGKGLWHYWMVCTPF